METTIKIVRNVFLIPILIQVIIVNAIRIPFQNLRIGGAINVMIAFMVIQDASLRKDVIIILQMIN